MTGVMILFAFTLSLVINFFEKKVGSTENGNIGEHGSGKLLADESRSSEK